MNSGLQITIGIISSLVLFLYGLDNLSKELQNFASDKFRIIISKLAKNRILGVIIGALSTAFVQSSSAVTALTVTLVGTSIITFKQSLGIIFGANIGTTVTAQLALINIGLLAPTLIIVGFLFRLLGKKFKLISKPIFFTGFVLFALQLLSNNIVTIKDNALVIDFFSQLNNPLLALLISAIFTGLIHSSSVMSGIIVILVQARLIDVNIAIAMILGANVGSSLTALISSLELDSFAKRTGLSNLVFNLLGVTVCLIFMNQFITLINSLDVNMAQQVAYAHFIFNSLNTLVFIILLSPFAKLMEKLVPSMEEEIQFRTHYLGDAQNENTYKKIEAIKNELIHAVENTQKLYNYSVKIFYKPTKLNLLQIEKLEAYNDYLDDQITNAIIEISRKLLTEKRAESTVKLIRYSNIIEQLGDLAKDLSQVFLKMHKRGISPSTVNIASIQEIEKQFIDLLNILKATIKKNGPENLQQLKELEAQISKEIEKHLDIHIQKLQNEKGYVGSVFIDSLSVMELSVAKVREIRKILE